MPHKINVLSFLKIIDSKASKIGAVNMLKWSPLGYKGYNTDEYGIQKAIKNTAKIKIKKNPVIVFGTGGAAFAAVSACLKSNCKKIYVIYRNYNKLQELIRNNHTCFESIFYKKINFNSIPKKGLFINATPLGSKKKDCLPINLHSFSKELFVFDMLYKPKKTKLLKEAHAIGMKYSNGIPMLVWQGVKSLTLWTKQKISFKVMINAAQKAIKD